MCSKFKIGVQVSSEAFSYTDLINWIALTRMMFLSETLGIVLLDFHEGSYFAQAPSKPVLNMCSVVIRILVKSRDFSQLKSLTPHLTSFLVPLWKGTWVFRDRDKNLSWICVVLVFEINVCLLWLLGMTKLLQAMVVRHQLPGLFSPSPSGSVDPGQGPHPLSLYCILQVKYPSSKMRESRNPLGFLYFKMQR